MRVAARREMPSSVALPGRRARTSSRVPELREPAASGPGGWDEHRERQLRKQAAVRTVAEILSGEALTPIRRSSVSGTRYLAEPALSGPSPRGPIQSGIPQADRRGPIPIGAELEASYVDHHDVTVGIEPCIGSQLAGADFELQLHC